MKYDRRKQHTIDRQIIDEKHSEVHRTHEDNLHRTQSRHDRGRADQTISRNPDPRRRPDYTHDSRRRHENTVTEAPHTEQGRTYKGTVFDSDFRNTGRYKDTWSNTNTVSRNDPRYSQRHYDERYYEMLYRDLYRRYEDLLNSRNLDTRLEYVESNNRDNNRDNESVSRVGLTNTNSARNKSHKDLTQLCVDKEIQTNNVPENSRCVCSSSMSMHGTELLFEMLIFPLIVLIRL